MEAGAVARRPSHEASSSWVDLPVVARHDRETGVEMAGIARTVAATADGRGGLASNLVVPYSAAKTKVSAR